MERPEKKMKKIRGEKKERKKKEKKGERAKKAKKAKKSGGDDDDAHQEGDDEDDDDEAEVEEEEEEDTDVSEYADEELGLTSDDDAWADDDDGFDSDDDVPSKRGKGRGRGSGRKAGGGLEKTPRMSRGRGRGRGKKFPSGRTPWLSQDAEDDLGEAADEMGGWGRDYTHLSLKIDHGNRPMWVLPDGRIMLESHSPVYKQAYDFLIAIAEPLTRPEVIHEYVLTAHSLYAAVSVGLTTTTIIQVLNRMSKVGVPTELVAFIHECTKNYGKVKCVLKQNRFWVESPDKDVLSKLISDGVIKDALAGEKRIVESGRALLEHAAIDLARDTVDAMDAKRNAEAEAEEQRRMKEAPTAPRSPTSRTAPGGAGPSPQSTQPVEEEAAEEQKRAFETYEVIEGENTIWAFEIASRDIEKVKARCLPNGLNFPMLEEYDFKNDRQNASLPMDLKPNVRLRPYQEKCLSKMFGNGRARSGIVVLPCGAGKTLTGIAAATRIKKSTLVLCKNVLAAEQWAGEFSKWSTVRDYHVANFVAHSKQFFQGDAGVLITTYAMLTGEGKRGPESEAIIEMIKSMEWGLLILDEVHVAPANDFRKSFGIVKSHCKLGLTATLVREDERINDLHFLIGPKLYEANWSDLAKDGHIATVLCFEVWCPMAAPFMREYLKRETNEVRKRLWICNPNKYIIAEFLMHWHEDRRDRVIIFSDNVFSIEHMARTFNRRFIHGKTPHANRMQILEAFKAGRISTLLLSQVGDDSLDIPDANVIIQIGSLGASRRQEAQRLGRILRKKAGTKRQGSVEADAFFYALVSRDTREMYFSAKRQRFLVDQGYAYQVRVGMHVDDIFPRARWEMRI